jgi:hypothetical protein
MTFFVYVSLTVCVFRCETEPLAPNVPKNEALAEAVKKFAQQKSDKKKSL